MLELRILDGLQTGARLKLPDSRYVIGDSDDCDIVLVGHGVEAIALHLAIDGDSILAMPRQSGCGIHLTDNSDEEFRLIPGQAFRVADIWLAVDMEDSPWPPQRSWLKQAEAMIADQIMPQQLPADEARQLASGNADAGSTLAAAPDAAPSRVGRWLAVGFIATIVCGSALAYVMKPASDVVPKEKWAISRAVVKTTDASQASAPAAIEQKQAVPAALPEQRSVSSAVSELAQSLAEHRLSKQLQITNESNSIQIHGELNSDQQPILETILVPFIKKYGDLLAINANILPPSRNLPFGITQISSGPLAHIVTDDGVRMFVGGTYKGYRLAAVNEHKLLFSGERPVEINW